MTECKGLLYTSQLRNSVWIGYSGCPNKCVYMSFLSWSYREDCVSNSSFVYLLKMVEICFVVTNDGLEGKTTHFIGFYTQSVLDQKSPNHP